MSATGLGTVTYNDGKRVLAFGHPFFNLGPVDMPMSKGEVLMVLSSSYSPLKLANATEIVGALHQDRHSGIMGVLGDSGDGEGTFAQRGPIGQLGAAVYFQCFSKSEMDAIPDDDDAVQLRLRLK
jgi:hypothetical protein